MNKLSVHHSSKRQDWETPQDFFDRLDAEFAFDLDVCATRSNAKCERFYSKADDGLAQPWTGTCWCNPPYRQIKHWLRKARESADFGATVVCLIVARPGSHWWNDYVMTGELRFVHGRLWFVGAEAPAPFPSAVVIFRPHSRAVSLGPTMSARAPFTAASEPSGGKRNPARVAGGHGQDHRVRAGDSRGHSRALLASSLPQAEGEQPRGGRGGVV